MNNCIALVSVSTATKGGSIDGSRIAFRVTMRYEDRGEIQAQTIAAEAYGKVAEQIQGLKDGSSALVLGSMQSIKTQDGIRPMLSVSKVWILEGSQPLAQIDLIGNVGQDPEIRYFESGANKAACSIAVSRNRDATDWFSIEAWGKTAETIGSFVSKGSKIGVSGKVRFERWTDKNTGEDRMKLVVVCDRVTLISSRREHDQLDEAESYSNGRSLATAGVSDNDPPF